MSDENEKKEKINSKKLILDENEGNKSKKIERKNNFEFDSVRCFINFYNHNNIENIIKSRNLVISPRKNYLKKNKKNKKLVLISRKREKISRGNNINFTLKTPKEIKMRFILQKTVRKIIFGLKLSSKIKKSFGTLNSKFQDRNFSEF